MAGLRRMAAITMAITVFAAPGRRWPNRGYDRPGNPGLRNQRLRPGLSRLRTRERADLGASNAPPPTARRISSRGRSGGPPAGPVSAGAPGSDRERVGGVGEDDRRAKCYRITAAGRRRLGEEEASWEGLVAAMTAVLSATPKGI